MKFSPYNYIFFPYWYILTLLLFFSEVDIELFSFMSRFVNDSFQDNNLKHGNI